MSKQKENKGLCSSCNSDPTCSHSKDGNKPILQCEEFDGYAPAPIRTKMKRTAVTSAAPDSGKYKGLCVNCENRKTCNHPKPEGGVWHCEEYK